MNIFYFIYLIRKTICEHCQCTYLSNRECLLQPSYQTLRNLLAQTRTGKTRSGPPAVVRASSSHRHWWQAHHLHLLQLSRLSTLISNWVVLGGGRRPDQLITSHPRNWSSWMGKLLGRRRRELCLRIRRLTARISLWMVMLFNRLRIKLRGQLWEINKIKI